MHREGHYGVALLAYAPIAFLLLEAGLTELALAGGAIFVGGAMLPNLDMRVPFVKPQGITHTVWFAIATNNVTKEVMLVRDVEGASHRTLREPQSYDTDISLEDVAEVDKVTIVELAAGE